MKAAGIAILCFLLFMSLSVFGLAFMLNNTILNPRFISAEINKLDISKLVDEALNQYSFSGIPTDMHSSIISAIDELEPEVKVQLGEVLFQVNDYLLGREQSLDMTQILKDTVLDEVFLGSLIDKAGVKELVREQLRDELVDVLPAGERDLVWYLDEALPAIDPWLTEQVDAASEPLVDYLLGNTSTLHISIYLEPMKDTLEQSLREAFLGSPPPELAGASTEELHKIFDDYYQQFSPQVPRTIIIDEMSLGIGSNDGIVEAITGIEDSLASAKTIIGLFRVYYVGLIILIVLLVLGIVLIHRNVKGATRELGIVFLTFGGLEYIGILIGKYVIRNTVPLTDLPSNLQSWVPVLVTDIFRPLEVLSLILAGTGIALIIVSIVYQRRNSQRVAVRSDQQL
jgi:hypothetical protein